MAGCAACGQVTAGPGGSFGSRATVVAGCAAGSQGLPARALVMASSAQIQPPPRLPLRLQVREHCGKPCLQRGELGVLRLDHRAQPRHQLALLARRIGLTGHKPQACST